jgi:plasmid stabilization system protein ParE
MAAEGARGPARHPGLYWQGQSDQARSIGQELHEKIQPLAEQPELGRTDRPGLLDHLRELVVHRNYVIFYRVLADARIEEILRVKHVAQQTP